MNSSPVLDEYLLALLDNDSPAAAAKSSQGPAVPQATVQAQALPAQPAPVAENQVPASVPLPAENVVALAPAAISPSLPPRPSMPTAAPQTRQSPPPLALAQLDESSGVRARNAERTTRWLRMRCDEQHYALELLKVQEVARPGMLLPLRGAPRHMLGVMNLRGQIVPVIDLGLYLDRQAIVPDPATRIVVLEEEGEILGLRVSAVEDVTNLTDQQIEAPGNDRSSLITSQLFRGIARLGGRTVILLDASSLL